jgi:hypothetical protein
MFLRQLAARPFALQLPKQLGALCRRQVLPFHFGHDQALRLPGIGRNQQTARSGGSVALGNDYTDVPQNNFPHFELGMPMHEIERMAESGMTAMQVIVAATRNAATVCNLGRELGTLDVGKVADVLVVNGNPLQDIHALANVRAVIHNGNEAQAIRQHIHVVYGRNGESNLEFPWQPGSPVEWIREVLVCR